MRFVVDAQLPPALARRLETLDTQPSTWPTVAWRRHPTAPFVTMPPVSERSS